MKSREERLRDFLDNAAMWFLLIMSMPFMLVVIGLSKIYKLILKRG